MLPLEIGEEEGLEVEGMVPPQGNAAVEFEPERLELERGGERGMEEVEEKENEKLELAHCLVEDERERVLRAVLMVAQVEAHSLSSSFSPYCEKRRYDPCAVSLLCLSLSLSLCSREFASHNPASLSSSLTLLLTGSFY